MKTTSPTTRPLTTGGDSALELADSIWSASSKIRYELSGKVANMIMTELNKKFVITNDAFELLYDTIADAIQNGQSPSEIFGEVDNEGTRIVKEL